MALKKQLIEEIEKLLDFDGGFLSKLSKKDLRFLKKAIESKDHTSDVESQPESEYNWGIVLTDCGEFKSSGGRSRGVSIQVAKATSLCGFAVAYWRLKKMVLIGLLGQDMYVHSTGEGEVDFYDVTHYGIDGLADSDPDFWCEMQVSGLGSGLFFWIPDAPPEMQIRASKAIQNEHSVGSTDLDRLFPPFVKSWKKIQELQNQTHEHFQKIIVNIDEICYTLYDGYDNSFIDTIDMMITQIAQQPHSSTMIKPKEIANKLELEEAGAELIAGCLLDIQSACAS